MGLIGKGKGVFLTICFLLLIGVIINENVNTAYCSLSPLDPSIEVTPDHTFLGGEITLTVKVLVNENSNVTVSMPQTVGVGDVSLLSEVPFLTSVLVDAGKVASLNWIYNATKTGNIHFTTKISVTKIIDGNVTLSEELTSEEVGITTYPRTSLLGFIIISLFVMFTSNFSESKPKKSLWRLIGGFFGLSIMILCAITGGLIGYFVTSELQASEMQQMFILLLFSSILSILGYYSCVASKPRTKSTYSKIEIKLSPNSIKVPIEQAAKKIYNKWTELSGALFVIFGLSGFFYSVGAFLGLIFMFITAVLVIYIEHREMKD